MHVAEHLSMLLETLEAAGVCPCVVVSEFALRQLGFADVADGLSTVAVDDSHMEVKEERGFIDFGAEVTGVLGSVVGIEVQRPGQQVRKPFRATTTRQAMRGMLHYVVISEERFGRVGLTARRALNYHYHGLALMKWKLQKLGDL